MVKKQEYFSITSCDRVCEIFKNVYGSAAFGFNFFNTYEVTRSEMNGSGDQGLL